MPRVTVVSDIHYGAPGEDISLLPLIMHIEEEQPDAVFVLGDVIHDEGTLYDCVDRLEHVVNRIDETGVDAYFLGGNHDANVMNADLFSVLVGQDLDRIVEIDDQEFVLVDTAFESDSWNIGKISSRGFQSLEIASDDAIVLSHFPLTYTDWYQDSTWFNKHPEMVFPTNKGYVKEMSEKPSVYICGHMHFDHGVTWSADGTWNKSIAPYTQFREDTDDQRVYQHGLWWTFDTEMFQ